MSLYSTTARHPIVDSSSACQCTDSFLKMSPQKFRRVRKEDAGEYYCQAKNDAGHAQCPTQIMEVCEWHSHQPSRSFDSTLSQKQNQTRSLSSFQLTRQREKVWNNRRKLKHMNTGQDRRDFTCRNEINFISKQTSIFFINFTPSTTVPTKYYINYLKAKHTLCL